MEMGTLLTILLKNLELHGSFPCSLSGEVFSLCVYVEGAVNAIL